MTECLKFERLVGSRKLVGKSERGGGDWMRGLERGTGYKSRGEEAVDEGD